MSRKVLLSPSDQRETTFSELLIGDYFQFPGDTEHYCRSEYEFAVSCRDGGTAPPVKVLLSSAVIKIGFSTDSAELPKLMPTVYVATAEVVDPVTKNTVQVEIRRMESGPMVGLDAAYLEDLASDPSQDYPVDPYCGEPLYVADDEGPGSHAVLIGRHRMPGETFVEFLLAYDDMSWDAYGVPVPFVTTDEHQFVLWAKEELLPQPFFANVSQVGVFKVHEPEAEDASDGASSVDTAGEAETDG